MINRALLDLVPKTTDEKLSWAAILEGNKKIKIRFYFITFKNIFEIWLILRRLHKLPSLISPSKGPLIMMKGCNRNLLSCKFSSSFYAACNESLKFFVSYKIYSVYSIIYKYQCVCDRKYPKNEFVCKGNEKSQLRSFPVTLRIH